MNKLIIRVVRSALLLSIIGIAFVILGDNGSLGIYPFVGMIFSRRGSKEPSYIELPEPHNGLAIGNPTKEEYVKEQTEHIKTDTAYAGKLREATDNAELYWNRKYTQARRVSEHTENSNWCNLYDTYYDGIGLTSKDAFLNTFNAYIKRDSNGIGGRFSVDYTIGEFLQKLVQVHCLDCYMPEGKTSMLDALMELRDTYGVRFNKPTPPPIEEKENISSISIADDINILQVDDDEIELVDDDQPIKSITPNDGDLNPNNSSETWCEGCSTYHINNR